MSTQGRNWFSEQIQHQTNFPWEEVSLWEMSELDQCTGGQAGLLLLAAAHNYSASAFTQSCALFSSSVWKYFLFSRFSCSLYYKAFKGDRCSDVFSTQEQVFHFHRQLQLFLFLKILFLLTGNNLPCVHLEFYTFVFHTNVNFLYKIFILVSDVTLISVVMPCLK